MRLGTIGKITGLAALLSVLALASCESREAEDGDAVARTGTLVVTVGRTSSEATVQRYYLSERGQWTPLSVDGPVDLEPNSRVRVTGKLAADGVTIQVDDIVPDAQGGTIRQALSTSAPEGSVAVFLIKQTGTADPFPVGDVQDTLFDNSDSTAAFFSEVSRDNFTLSGDIFGWHEHEVNDCNGWGALNDAMAEAAANDGFVTDDYRHAIAVISIPEGGADCGIAWGTLGQPDGTGTVVSYWNNSNTFAHELGHNVGLHHASSVTCRDTAKNIVPFSQDCQWESYNDPFDGMGYQGYYRHFNAYSKRLLDWLPVASQATVTTSGDFHLTAQEQAASGLQALYIPIPGTGDALHVEVREQFGFDNEDWFDGAVLVRRVRQSGLGQQTYLVDMTPVDRQRTNAGLVVGQTYDDPLSGISITLTALAGNEADVHVAFGGPSCVDGVLNGAEVGVDCGGPCGTCALGDSCVLSSDCASVACSAGVCVASTGGWRGQYYGGVDFEALLATRNDPAIDFIWEGSPMYPVPGDGFSVRWSGTLVAPTTELYTFFADMDDGVRVWVGDQLIIDRWHYEVEPAQGQVSLTANQEYPVRIDFYESGGPGQARLLWSTPTRARDVVSPLFVAPAGPACTVETATDIGPPTSATVSVPNNACVKITQYPSWWNWGSRVATVQASGGGGFPLAMSWEDTCTGAKGTSTIAASYESAPVGVHNRGCVALVKLAGSGSANVGLRWW